MTERLFHRLNTGWNAEPNAPDEQVTSDGAELRFSFNLNPWAYRAEEGERAALVFSRCAKWRLGPTNDEGWYSGQCRYSSAAPEWGEFYEIAGDDPLCDQPSDWNALPAESGGLRHFLFYLRDQTFECMAADWRLERSDS